MKYAFFTVPVFDAEKAKTDLNRFIANHRIAHVEKQFVACGEQSFCNHWVWPLKAMCKFDIVPTELPIVDLESFVGKFY